MIKTAVNAFKACKADDAELKSSSIRIGRTFKAPCFKKAYGKILSVAVDINDRIELADTAEERSIEEGRHLNREALAAWAVTKIDKTARKDEKTLLAQYLS